MNIIVKDNLVVRIPEKPSRYRANCHKDWGSFITGETNGMNILKATEAGLVKGSFVEMALVYIDHKILTFEPHYINENFTEIWGIPVAGEMKTQFADKASELSTFLLHRQSQDKLANIIEDFSRNAFNEWVSDGMKGEASEYALNKMNEYYFGNIFRFEMTPKEGKHGTYHFVAISSREPANELEKDALLVAKEIYETHPEYCVDQRLVENQEQSLGLIEGSEQAALPEGKKSKAKAK
jgi:hypothetical protein